MKKHKSNTNGLVYSTDPNFKMEEEEVQQETLPPAQQNLQVKLDTKQRAGKAVTLITGFVGKDEDLQALGKALRNYCGTGGSAKHGEIIVQGDQREKVTQWLRGKSYKVR